MGIKNRKLGHSDYLRQEMMWVDLRWEMTECSIKLIDKPQWHFQDFVQADSGLAEIPQGVLKILSETGKCGCLEIVL